MHCKRAWKRFLLWSMEYRCTKWFCSRILIAILPYAEYFRDYHKGALDRIVMPSYDDAVNDLQWLQATFADDWSVHDEVQLSFDIEALYTAIETTYTERWGHGYHETFRIYDTCCARISRHQLVIDNCHAYIREVFPQLIETRQLSLSE